MTFRIFLGIVFCFTTFWTPPLAAQPSSQDTTEAGKWRVGVYEFPPFMMKNNANKWEGVSVELWQDLADSLDIVYQLEEVRQEQATSQLQNGSLDAVLLLPVSPDSSGPRFSHIYHTAMLGVASAQSLSSIAQGLFTMRFLRIVITLSILLLIVGTMIWWVERKTNEDNFGGERNPLQGIGSGFWWAGVTMTTIGYGDKAPVTFWGRAIALLWMLVAMAVTASLTAALVSAVGGGTAAAVKVPDDLRKKEVGTVSDSPFGQYLAQERVKFKSYDSVEQGLKDVAAQKLNTFVHSVPAMRYWVHENSNISVQVTNSEVLPQRYAMALSPSDTTVSRINRPLIKIINQPNWQQRINRYMPK